VVLLRGAATITELMLPDREATTSTMPTAAPPRGLTVPAQLPDAGVARLPGIMGVEAPTALEAVPLRGAAVPEALQDSEAALLHGEVVPVPTTELTAVPAPGVGDSSCPVPEISGMLLRSKSAVGKARGGSISELIRDRRATQPPADFHRNPPGRGHLAIFLRRSGTSGNKPAISGTGH